MTATQRCRQCGTELGSGAPEGLCPECLGKVTFAVSTGHSQGPATTGEAPTAESPAPPVIGAPCSDDSELGKDTAQGGAGVAARAPQASPGRPVDRAVKWSERKLAVAGLATAVVVVAALGVVGWLLVMAARQDRARLLRQTKAARDAIAVQLAAHGIAARDQRVRPSLVDLSLHYNLGLTQPRDSFDPENSLAPLAAGTAMLGGVEFDVRGTVQLGGSNRWVSGYPFHGTGIPVGQRGRRVHFLHGTLNWERPGVPIAVCVMHCADGQTYEQPIRYGADVQDWWDRGTNQVRAGDSTPVWRGQNPVSKRQNAWLRLFKMTWVNPRPDVTIETVDFQSKQTKCGPFLVAITVETPDSPESWMSEAQELGEKGEWAKALAALDQAAQRLPHRPEVWIARERLLESSGQTNEALEAVSRAIELALADTNAFGTVLTGARLGRFALLKQLNRLDEAAAENLATCGIPSRDPRTKPELLDLSLVYTHELTGWLSIDRDSEAANTFGDDVRKFTGLDFDLRGLVRLAGTNWVGLGHEPAPHLATDIPVARHFARMHIVHGARPTETDGVRIGAYVLHYVDGQTQALPIIFGEHLRERDPPPETPIRVTKSAVVAWSGRDRGGNLRRLYRTTYENPRPSVAVRSIDFVSTMTKSGPFLIAITVEP
jgi:hypothetical protein